MRDWCVNTETVRLQDSLAPVAGDAVSHLSSFLGQSRLGLRGHTSSTLLALSAAGETYTENADTSDDRSLELL